MNQRAAFTLVELLVVLVVVAVLAFLLMSGVNRVYIASSQARCVGNLKVIGAAARDYISDHNGCFPPHNGYAFFETNGRERIRTQRWHWMAHLAPYLGSPEAEGPMSPVFNCPADPAVPTWPKERPYLPGPGEDKPHILSSYGYNYAYLTTTASWWRLRDPGLPTRAHLVTNPTSLILFTDSREKEGDPIVHSFSNTAWPALRHQKRFNAVFLDGHVEALDVLARTDTQRYWIPK